MDKMSTRGPDPKFTDVEVIRAIQKEDRPVATAKSISKAVSLSGERTRQRLNRLAAEKLIEREKIAGGIVIYWEPSADSLESA